MHRKIISGYAVLLLAALPAAAVVNPYVDPITSRNMFGLKSPPTAEELAAQNVKPAEPLPKVWLTGITTMMGGKMALLRVQRPAKPPEPAKEIPLMLGEGGPAEEEVQVLSIDVAAGTVQISNRGTPQLLDITKDSPKAAAAPAPAAAPGAVPGLRPGMPVPIPAGGVPPPSGGIPIPPRPVRGTGAGTETGSQPVIGGGPGGIQNQPQPAQNLPPLEEQIVMIEVNRMRTQHLVDAGEQPPLPPTELQEIIQQEQGQVPPPQPPF